MNFLRFIRDFIKSLDDQLFYRYAAIIIAVVIVIMSGLMYWQIHSLNKEDKKLVVLGREREKTEKIVRDYKKFDQQRKEVDAILSKDESFKIKEQYQDIVQQVGLAQYQKEEPIVSPGGPVGDKSEIRLSASLDGINMKQLTDLLMAIASNERIYPVELELKKSSGLTPSLEVELKIATLESKQVERGV